MIADIEKLDIAEGRYFTESENNNSMRVAYVGKDIATKLFPFGGALGEEIVIRGIPYRIIGVQTAKGTVFGQPQDNFIVLPIKTYGSNFGGLRNQRAPYFIATAKSDKLFNDAVEEARTLLRIKRKIPTGEKDNFGIMTPDAITGIRDRLFRSDVRRYSRRSRDCLDRRRYRDYEYYAGLRHRKNAAKSASENRSARGKPIF